jgi:hypothetical protein
MTTTPICAARKWIVALAVGVVTAAGLVAIAAPASATTANPTPLAGSRKNATRLSFQVSGTAGLSVDVGSGNALFTDQLLTLPGVRGDVPISLSYNSSVFGTSTPSAVTGGTGSGWAITGFDERMVTNADSSVTFYGPGGLTGVFVSTGSGQYSSPAQFEATLIKAGSVLTLVDHRSQQILTFTAGGRLSTDADRDGNTTSYGFDSITGLPSTIISSRGGTTTRTATITMSSGQMSSISQASGSLSRSIGFGYSPNGHLASVTDSIAGVTSFASAAGTDTGQVVTVTNPRSKTSTLSFSSGKVSQVSQQNPP